MKWRPIKTAPKDRLILLSCNEHPEYPPYVCVGRWIDIPHTNEVHWLLMPEHLRTPPNFLSKDITTLEQLATAHKADGHWHDGYVGIMQGHGVGQEWQAWEFRGGILFRPTHWMPLPQSPKTRIKKS